MYIDKEYLVNWIKNIKKPNTDEMQFLRQYIQNKKTFGRSKKIIKRLKKHKV